MELGEAALCGSIDEATLVCVSAGICLANLIVTPSFEDQGKEETLQLLGWRLPLRRPVESTAYYIHI